MKQENKNIKQKLVFIEEIKKMLEISNEKHLKNKFSLELTNLKKNCRNKTNMHKYSQSNLSVNNTAVGKTERNKSKNYLNELLIKNISRNKKYKPLRTSIETKNNYKIDTNIKNIINKNIAKTKNEEIYIEEIILLSKKIKSIELDNKRLKNENLIATKQNKELNLHLNKLKNNRINNSKFDCSNENNLSKSENFTKNLCYINTINNRNKYTNNNIKNYSSFPLNNSKSPNSNIKDKIDYYINHFRSNSNNNNNFISIINNYNKNLMYYTIDPSDKIYQLPSNLRRKFINQDQLNKNKNEIKENESFKNTLNCLYERANKLFNTFTLLTIQKK